jgi:hypothetical protein
VFPALPAWARHPSERTKDIALAAVLAVPVMGTAIAEAVHDDRPWQVAIGAVAVLTVLFRRRWPFPALAVAAAGAIVANPDGAPALAVLVVLYTIASTRPWRTTAITTAVLVAGNALDAVVDGHPVYFGDMVAFAVQCAAVVALGLFFAARRATLDALRERAERMDRERELLADRAVAEERVRIAQELHDVVAHNVSLIVVKAQALGATVHDDRVVEATDGIARPRPPGDGGDATHTRAAAHDRRRHGAARAAARPGQPRQAPRAVARSAPRRPPRRRGRAARALPEPGPVGLSHRPGGADQRAQARRPRAGERHRRLPPARPGAQRGRQRRRERDAGHHRRRGCGTRARRHA